MQKRVVAAIRARKALGLAWICGIIEGIPPRLICVQFNWRLALLAGDWEAK